MSTLEQPFFDGVSFTIMIGEVEVTLSPHQQFTNLAFDCVDLSRLNLFSCTFDNCTFADCKMSNTDWSGTLFTNCTFGNCNMETSVMYETVLKGCEFAKCDLTGVRTFVSTFENVHFSKCSLSSMRVIETNFFHTEFEDCTFTAANWHYCIIAFSALYNVRATGAPLCLSFTAIIQTKLRDVDLYEANLDHCSFTRAKIIKCNFWKSTFHEPTFEDCTISNVGMNETMISDGVFFKSPLFACRVRLVHFDNCVFDESDIVGCALGGADLSSTILYESRLIDNRKSEGNDYPAVLP